MEDSSLLIMNGYHKPHHRVLKPPGGDTHDIFGTGNPSAYNEATEASRRARSANHHAQLTSNIFDPIPYTNGKFKENGNGNGVVVVHRGSSESEKNSDEEEIVSENGSIVALDEIDGKPETKKLVKDHMRSNVFTNWNDAATNGNHAPRRQSNGGGGGGNPITGEGYSNGCCNSNGESKDSSRRSGKYPPGGPSSNLW